MSQLTPDIFYHQNDGTCLQKSTNGFSRATISRAVTAGFVDSSVVDEINEEQEHQTKLMKLKLQGYVVSNAFLKRKIKAKPSKTASPDYLPAIKKNAQMVSGHMDNGQIGNSQVSNAEMVNSQMGNGQRVNGKIVNGQMVNGPMVNCRMDNVQMNKGDMDNEQMGNDQMGIRQMGNGEMGNEEIDNALMGNRHMGNRQRVNQTEAVPDIYIHSETEDNIKHTKAVDLYNTYVASEESRPTFKNDSKDDAIGSNRSESSKVVQECADVHDNVRAKVGFVDLDKDDDDGNSVNSDEFDTDLESEERFGKKTPSTDIALGVTRYIRECERNQLPVQQEVVNGLQRRFFSLKNRSLGPAHIRALCAALKDNLRAESVNLQGTDVGEAGIQAVAQMMLENTCIIRMNLSNNGLAIRAAQVLGHVMVVSDHLTHLNLSGNKLGDDAAWYLSSAFESNESIEHLDLSYNELGEQGGVILATGLALNKGLLHLNISWNKLVGKGCVAIYRALVLNTTLITLNFSWNGMAYEGAVALSKCLRGNTGLRDLDVSSNRLDHRCAHLVAVGIRANTTLTKLRIGHNPLTTTGCMDILEATTLPSCNITLLDCSEVPVVGEADLLSATIGRRRNFTFIHGGIVPTHDKLGERIGREINPMLRIIEYLRLLGLRPLELMRSFDRTTSFEMPRKDFVEQIKKIGVKLHPFEIEALANSISSKGTNKNIINYRKLCVAVREVVVKERERKIRERTQRAQIRTYHHQILQKGSLQELHKSSPSVSTTRPSSGPGTQRTFGKVDSKLAMSMATPRSNRSDPGKALNRTN